MDPIANARRLRREQTTEEKELWRALRAGRFAGFKFRRQHPFGNYTLDFYCPMARLSIELDGFHHGCPEQVSLDEERKKFLQSKGIEELRFWNHQWRKNREGVLLKIWNTLHERTGCTAVMRKTQNHRYVPPKIEHLRQGKIGVWHCRSRRLAIKSIRYGSGRVLYTCPGASNVEHQMSFPPEP